MSTKAITTSLPDVACDVCGRRLLRGERPDVFLAAGDPRTVCELCAPRAVHQGWTMSSEEHRLAPPPLRPGRGRGLFERLRQSRRIAVSNEERLGGSGDAGGDGLVADDGVADDGMPYDFRADGDAGADPASSDGFGLLPEEPAGPLQQALEVFNAGEYPRRVASLTRSLGAPEVSVRPGEAVASSVVIVIAWELCWYSYEVDLDDLQGSEARALAQGTELDELREEDRLANARADERGALALIGAPA